MIMQWPELRINLPVVGDVNINAAFFRKFDYSNSMVCIVLSPPSYFKLSTFCAEPEYLVFLLTIHLNMAFVL
jgi:hypothetical protein